MTFKESILYILLWPYYHTKFRFKVDYSDFDKNRTDPYILLANHVSLHDALYTAIMIKRKYPFPVVNAFMYTNRLMKFFLTKIVHSIPKRKGQSDIATIRGMIDLVKNQRRGVMLFPEGNSSYFGEQGDIPFSTAKLLKFMKLDIILSKVGGGYLSAPRWGKPVRKGIMEINFRTLFKSSELELLSVEEIYEKLTEAMRFNDFDWNREKQYKYDLRNRAEGLEGYLYVCPKCHGHQCLYTKREKIFCFNCGEIAHFNEYSFLELTIFDNLVDWGRFQKTLIPEIAKKELKTVGVLHLVDMRKSLGKKICKVEVVLDQSKLKVTGRKFAKEFSLAEINGLVLTKKRDLSFDFGDETYYIAVKDPMLFLDAINHLKGGNIHG